MDPNQLPDRNLNPEPQIPSGGTTPPTSPTNPGVTFTAPAAWKLDQTQQSPLETQIPISQPQSTNPEPVSPVSMPQPNLTPTQPTSLPSQVAPSSSNHSGFARIFFTGLALILFGILIGVVAARFIPLPVNNPNPITTPTPTISLTPSLTPVVDPNDISNWETYTNTDFNFTFKHPSDYQLSQPVPGGGAPEEGNFTFYSAIKGKADMFFLDVTPFSGNLTQFVDKYTPYDPGMKEKVISLHVGTPLGKLLEKTTINSIPVVIYNNLTQYDQKVNPGAVDINSYYGFFVLDGQGYILRANGISDIAKFKQIISSFHTLETMAAPSGVSCQYKGKTYKDGESFKDSCNSCSCESGEIACTTMACL